MTFSLLARDPETGALGGVAATGNLCVGGWVLRGDPAAGLTASQGKTPSTLWGEDALRLLERGNAPDKVVSELIAGDEGRNSRQLSVLSANGASGVYDGSENQPFTGHIAGDGWIIAGNWLTSSAVLDACAEAFESASGDFPQRLLDALAAGVDAGSDSRGTQSAALLVVAADRPPLSLRVDWDEAPVARLRDLYRRTRAPDYADWLDTLPTRERPEGR